MRTLIRLMAVLLVLFACSCQSTKYQGKKFKMSLDSNPTGAKLYLVPRRSWHGIAAPQVDQNLDRWLVKANGGMAPVADYWVVDYQHVLVGRLGDARGELAFRPTHHGQKVVVTVK